MRIASPVLLLVALSMTTAPAAASRKLLVAHRGASAYAPEHTLASYRLAVQHRADFVEQDLAVTSDGVLVCAHDPTLQRTTNVEEVFPDRFREADGRRQWFIADFTLEEIKRLDAGSWFDPKFAGEKIPTFQEAIDLVRGHAGLFAELKAPGLYRDRGIDMEPLVVTALRKNGLDQRSADPATPVILQSFDAEALRAVARDLPAIDRTFLFDTRSAAEWTTSDGLKSVSLFATGIGPAKAVLESDPSIVARAHAAGLTVIPYTFRASATGRFPTVRDEMAHFLTVLDVDGVFTDNPDLFPR